MTQQNRKSQPAGTAARFSNRRAWGIARSAIFLAALVGLAVWLSRGNMRVVSVTPSTALDDLFRPVAMTDVFGPKDTFFVSVKLENYREGVPLLARWKYGATIINETPLKTSDVGDGYAGFSARNSQSWPVGDYSVEIVSNGTVMGSASFRVEEAKSP